MCNSEEAERNYKRFLSDTNKYCNTQKEERINKRLLVIDSEATCNNGIKMNERLFTTVANEGPNSNRVRS